MFTKQELQELITLVNSAVMKSNLHYGGYHKHTKMLYDIRDKLLKMEESKNGKRTQILLK